MHAISPRRCSLRKTRAACFTFSDACVGAEEILSAYWSVIDLDVKHGGGTCDDQNLESNDDVLLMTC